MSDHDVRRLERKVDLLLQIAGATLQEVEQLGAEAADEAMIRSLANRLKAGSDALKNAVAANQPK